MYPTDGGTTTTTTTAVLQAGVRVPSGDGVGMPAPAAPFAPTDLTDRGVGAPLGRGELLFAKQKLCVFAVFIGLAGWLSRLGGLLI